MTRPKAKESDVIELRNPTAIKIWQDRYQKNGETLNEQLDRVAGFLADTPEEAKEFYDVMDKGHFFPAGRTMSNAGIGETLTLSNCFVVGSVPDSMNDIFDTVRIGAITQKAGGGTGYDFSSLRPNGSPTSNDAVASGPVSFMQIFDAGTSVILQSNRRGANMGCMSVYHPDIEEFIDCKADPNNPNNMQFFNLSVMVDDDFMCAVRFDEEVDLHFPVYREDFSIETDPNKWTHRKTIRARDLWDKIIRRAYENGEPGVLFYDTMNRLNNTSYCETIIGTNPCGRRNWPLYHLSISSMGYQLGANGEA